MKHTKSTTLDEDNKELERFLNEAPKNIPVWWPLWDMPAPKKNLTKIFDNPPSTPFYRNNGWRLVPI
jgi:hypothetical protein